MRRRRDVSVFGLSFLDVMFCGFGSVILLVMIINSETLAKRKEVHQDLRGEVKRLEVEVLTGEEYKVEIRNTLDQTTQQNATAQGQTKEVLDQLEKVRMELALLDKQAQASREHVNRLKSDLKRTEQDRRKLASEREEADKKGENVNQFVGDGDRQYLTGLKVGGERILILLDTSASMLDETIVNIIRLRNLPEDTRRKAKKWQRAVRTTEWLISQMPLASKFQVIVFNTKAQTLSGEAPTEWLDAGRTDAVDGVVSALNRVSPANGTSLYNAFDSVSSLQPRPDNVILITDGLPTQGKSGHSGARVTGKKRLSYFRQAIARLPGDLPINTILLPIEGDPMASSEFWKLAVNSGGSYMSPSRDWP